MNELIPDGKGIGDGFPKGVRPSCCQAAEAQGASCCNPRGGIWSKGKALLAALIIIAAIGVGAVSFMRGNAAQPQATPTSCPPAQCGATCDTSCAK